MAAPGTLLALWGKRPGDALPAPPAKRIPSEAEVGKEIKDTPSVSASSSSIALGKVPATAKRSAADRKKAWTKLRIVDVDGATYNDDSLQWSTLRDGRELLLCQEIWHVPAGFGAKGGAAATKLGATASSKFVAVPGHDLVACVMATATEVALAFHALPSNAVVGRVVLPVGPRAVGTAWDFGNARDVSLLASAPGANGMLAVSQGWMFWVHVDSAAPDAAAAAASSSSSAAAPVPAFTLVHAMDLKDPGSALAKELAFPAPKKATAAVSLFGRAPDIVQAVAVWVDGPGTVYALLGSKGRVLVVPLPQGPQGGHSKAAADDTGAGSSASGAGGSSGILHVSAVLDMHESMRKTDSPRISSIQVWHPAGGGGARVVTTGGDADVAVAALHASGSGCADVRWPAASRGTGPSKAHAYAAGHIACVNAADGVVFTASQSEHVAHVYDLETPKTSQAGKLLAKTGRLAAGSPRRVAIMCAAFSPALGLLAYSNSNDADDCTLKVVVPVG